MLILASNSPRRKQLLALGGWEFEVYPAQVDEAPRSGEAPRAYVLRLAEAKARVVAAESPQTAIVIAADTTVVDRGEILGKPVDAGEAGQMLRRLRGGAHYVYTALAVLMVSDHKLITDICTTQVPMRNYSEEELEAYIASGDPLDKAGAYAIQHPGFHPVTRLEGCYANVVGMPLCHLTRTLDRLGVKPEEDIPQVCQAAMDYECSIYARVLTGEA